MIVPPTVATLLLALGACGGGAPTTPEATLETVTTGTEIEAHDGERVRVQGVVVRPEMALGPGNTWSGTGLRLDDGTMLWVDYGKEPPSEWAHHEGQRVVVDARVWSQAPPDRKAAPTGPHLSDWSALESSVP